MKNDCSLNPETEHSDTCLSELQKDRGENLSLGMIFCSYFFTALPNANLNYSGILIRSKWEEF